MFVTIFDNQPISFSAAIKDDVEWFGYTFFFTNVKPNISKDAAGDLKFSVTYDASYKRKPTSAIKTEKELSDIGKKIVYFYIKDYLFSPDYQSYIILT